ncbi:hypothetical protein V8G54_036286 [Vigna mungo]|uniref:Uncharacterized protein n=1 Tax=Vigna mungo TaxID=3915 RepID=A0AAQ3MGM8_VIGMU
MAFEPKIESGSLLNFTPNANEKELGEMSISELVTVLRIAYKIEDFDKIEQELVKREAKLRAEIGPLEEKIELERLKRIEVEERLRIREEQCEKGKRAQDNYEQLLKEVKTGGLVEKHAIEELRKKNVALEREVYELKEFRKKMLDDVKSMDEIRDKIRVLKEEKVGDKNALDVLIMKNIELEEAVKKNLSVIEGLKNENGKLKDEKHELKTLFESLERRYSKPRVSDVKLEESTMPFMSEDASDCGNTEVEPNLGVSFAVKDEKDVSDNDLENDTGEPVPLQRDEDSHYSVDTGTGQSPKKGNKEDAVGALRVKFQLEKEIVDLSDDEDDDDKYTSQGLHGEKAISQIIEENEHPQRVEIIKRKLASDIEASTSTSTSSADLFEKENLPAKKIVSPPLFTSSSSFFPYSVLLMKTSTIKIQQFTCTRRASLAAPFSFGSFPSLMEFQLKTEHGYMPKSIPTATEYGEMDTCELVAVLRIAYKISDFDKIQQELVKREAKLRAEIGPLREKIELERLKRIDVEERLKVREEQCEKGKRAQGNYEQLLKEVKTGGLVEKHAIEELRKKNLALEREVYELEEFRKKMVDDVKSMDELRDKIRVLKEEKVGDKNSLDVLITKNIELEEAIKKNLSVIEELKNENAKLTNEKHELKTLFESLERRYSKLRVSDVKLEESTMPLISEDASDCGNTKVQPNHGVSFPVKDEKDDSDHELENDTGESVFLQRDEDTHYYIDTGTGQSPKKGNKEDAIGALGIKFKLEKEIVDLSDDDDKYTSQGLLGEKAISQIIEENEPPQRASTSTSTSFADLFEKENLPVNRSKFSNQYYM